MTVNSFSRQTLAFKYQYYGQALVFCFCFVAHVHLCQTNSTCCFLFFIDCGVYVNTHRQRTRPDHLMWPAKLIPTNPFGFMWPYLYVFTEAGLVVYDVTLGLWVSTLSGRLMRPLCWDSHLCLIQSLPSSPPSSLAHANGSETNTSGIGVQDSASTGTLSPAVSMVSCDSNIGQQIQRLVYLAGPPQDPSTSVNPFHAQLTSALRSRALDVPESTTLGMCVRVRVSVLLNEHFFRNREEVNRLLPYRIH